MVFTLEEDQQLSVTQRKTVKGMELQAPLDEHVNDDVNVSSLRGVMLYARNLTKKIEQLETTISKKYDAKFKDNRLKNYGMTIYRISRVVEIDTYYVHHLLYQSAIHIITYNCSCYCLHFIRFNQNFSLQMQDCIPISRMLINDVA